MYILDDYLQFYFVTKNIFVFFSSVVAVAVKTRPMLGSAYIIIEWTVSVCSVARTRRGHVLHAQYLYTKC